MRRVPPVTWLRTVQQVVSRDWIPLDEDGYVQSFAVEDTEGQRAFFDTYGFVVVRDVLDSTEVDATVDEIWTDTEALANRAKFDGDTLLSRDDPNTWKTWPSMGMGILGGDIAAGPQAWTNRQHPRVHQVYANLFGTEKLISSVDRYGIMRPTKNVKMMKKRKSVDAEGNEVEVVEEVVKDRPNWQTTEQWFHWDLAVWAWFGLAPCPDPQKEQDIHDGWLMSGAMKFITENNGTVDFKGYEKMQGLLALSDSTEEDGGFETVPGYHKFLETWAKQTPIFNKGSFVYVPKEDPLREHSQKITARKGSLVVWSSRMPHCNYPNTGPNFRFVQYLKMFPAVVMPPTNSSIWSVRAQVLRHRLPQGFEPSELGQLVFGLQPWEGLEAKDNKKCLLM